MILVIDTETNIKICEKLRESALATLAIHNINSTTIRVPSIFEIPAGINIASRKNFEGYIILACILDNEQEKQLQSFNFLMTSIRDFTLTKNLLITQDIIIADTTSEAKQYSIAKIKNENDNKYYTYGERATLAMIEMIKIKNAL